MASSGEYTIYVQLLDEGVLVWRPVTAKLERNGCYRILSPVPEDEKWEFPSGSLVRCRSKKFQGGERGLVAYEQAE